MVKIGVRQYILLAILAVLLSIVAIVVVQKTITTEAAAGINKQINFQGKVTEDNGLNVADGNYQFVFRFYTVSSGGSEVWEETVNLDVADGIFNHALGSVSSLPGSVDFNSDNIFLGITFNSDPDGEMTPRIQLTASPYAFNADQLDGLDSSDFLQLSPSVAQTGNIDITGSIDADSADFSGSVNITDDLTVGTDVLYVDTSTGFVGIGTASPDVALDVVGSARISDRLQIGSTVAEGQCLNGTPVTCSAGLQLEHYSTATTDPTYGANIQVVITPASENTALNSGVIGALVLAGSENYTGVNAGVQGYVLNTGTGAVNRAVGLLGIVGSYNNGIIHEAMSVQAGAYYSAGSIDTSFGVVVNNPEVSGGATVDDNYGLYINNQTAGTDLNVGAYIGGGSTYALYVDSGITRLNGNLVVDTDTLFVNSSTNRVGIGNTSPTVALEVTGDARISNRMQIGATTNMGQCPAFTPVTCDVGLYVGNTSTETSNESAGIKSELIVTPSGSNSYANSGGYLSLNLQGTQNYTGTNYGVRGVANNATTGGTVSSLVGVGGVVGSLATTTITNSAGVEASGTYIVAYVTNHYGLRVLNPTISVTGTITSNYGVHVANQSTGTDDYGIYVAGADTYALWIDSGTSRFDGNVVLNAALPAGDTADNVCRSSTGVLSTCTSASRFKQDVSDLDLGLEQLNLLQPVSYTWSSTGKADVGFIAEQVAAVIPQAVTYDDNGEVISFNYNTISALLVSSVQELDVRIKEDIEPRLAVVEQNVASISPDGNNYATAAYVQTLMADVTGRLGVLEQGNFSELTVSGNLSVAGILRVTSIALSGKFTTSGATPAVSVLGSSTGNVSVSGNDTSGEVQLIASGAATQMRVTFAVPFSGKPKPSITPTSVAAGQVRYYTESDSLGFTIHFIDPPQTGQTYSFSYFVVQ